MAESPLSPVAHNVGIDLQTNSAAVLNENANVITAPTQQTGSDLALSENFQHAMAAPFLIKNSELPTSSSDTEGEEQPQQEGALDNMDMGRPISPPPNCAICLGRCKNKCFTDSCLHQFCFKCLCEWSKVKPECPLCKQTFKSIIHNVKSNEDFEEYHVQPPTVQIPHGPLSVSYGHLYVDSVVVGSSDRNMEIPFADWHGIRRPRYFRDLLPLYPQRIPSAGPGGSRSSHDIGSSDETHNLPISRNVLFEMYRSEFPNAAASNYTLSQLWRRYIYDRKLYALPVCDITGRFRESSARFYRDNPSQVHRLVPWINRDVHCLMRENRRSISELMTNITLSLSMINIISPSFRRRMQPYFGSNTAHFIHELNNFARSPYDMTGYDRAVQYAPHERETIVIEHSSTTSSDEGTSNGNENSGRVRRNRRIRSNNTDPGNTDASLESVALGNDLINYRIDPFFSNPGLISTSNRRNLLSFTVGTTSEGSEAPGVTVSVNRVPQSAAINLSTHNRTSGLVIDLDDSVDVVGASSASIENNSASNSSPTSMTANLNLPTTSPVITANIELNTSSSDECEFVLERKPPHLRTPELVSLNSDSDSDVVFVDETKRNLNSFEAIDDDATAQSIAEKEKKEKRQFDSRLKNEEHEIYNVGPSTSAGLRLSLRRSKTKPAETEVHSHSQSDSTDNDKPDNKHNLRSKNRVLKNQRRIASSYDEPSYSWSTSSSSSSSSESYDEELDYLRKCRRKTNSKWRSIKLKKSAASPPSTRSKAPKRKKGSSKTNNENTRNFEEKQLYEQNDQKQDSDESTNARCLTKKRKPNHSSDDSSSDEDENYCLDQLKKRLTMQKVESLQDERQMVSTNVSLTKQAKDLFKEEGNRKSSDHINIKKSLSSSSSDEDFEAPSTSGQQRSTNHQVNVKLSPNNGEDLSMQSMEDYASETLYDQEHIYNNPNTFSENNCTEQNVENSIQNIDDRTIRIHEQDLNTNNSRPTSRNSSCSAASHTTGRSSGTSSACSNSSSSSSASNSSASSRDSLSAEDSDFNEHENNNEAVVSNHSAFPSNISEVDAFNTVETTDWSAEMFEAEPYASTLTANNTNSISNASVNTNTTNDAIGRPSTSSSMQENLGTFDFELVDEELSFR